MHENRTSRGPGFGLLLLVPAVMLVAKAAAHHRMAWSDASGEAPRLPPRAQQMLEAWHAQAHKASVAAATAPEASASA